jgi:hypothetical protein
MPRSRSRSLQTAQSRAKTGKIHDHKASEAFKITTNSFQTAPIQENSRQSAAKTVSNRGKSRFGSTSTRFGRGSSRFGRDSSRFGDDSSAFGGGYSPFGGDLSGFGDGSSGFGTFPTRFTAIETVAQTRLERYNCP